MIGSFVADAGLLDVNGTFLAELVAFILMLVALGRWVYPRIVAAAEARQRQIEEGLRASEEAEKRLQAVQADVERVLGDARGQARELIERATREASSEAEAVRRQAREDAGAQLERARADIGAERDRAVQELRAEVGSLVVIATTRVLGQVVDDQVHKRLIEESVTRVVSGSGTDGRTAGPGAGAGRPKAG